MSGLALSQVVCVCVSHFLHISAAQWECRVAGSLQTFLGLVFLGFALVIEAHCALVHAICLYAVSPPKPSGVVYTAKQVGGQGSKVRVKQHDSSGHKAAQFQTPKGLLLEADRLKSM